MRGRGAKVGVLAMLPVAALAACFDVLHSTADLRTACELDAGDPGCGSGAAPDAAGDFCAWARDEADRAANRACAWLGACELPFGDNAFGPCVFQARMAFDCAANPDHRVKGTAHALWDCLQRARSCAEVDACVFGGPRPGCAASDAEAPPSCAATTASTDVRALCRDADDGGARAYGENCALWGQTCAVRDSGSACAGQADESQCGESNCGADQRIHWCGGGVDEGIDCRSYGAAACGVFPEPTKQWTACVPEGDGGACAPSTSASCAGGVATMCLTGVEETVDCAALLGAPGTCDKGKLALPFDWTGPCSAGVACPVDACSADGGSLTSCTRGAPFTVNCAEQGLGPCRLVTADPASPPRSACTPLPP